MLLRVNASRDLLDSARTRLLNPDVLVFAWLKATLAGHGQNETALRVYAVTFGKMAGKERGILKGNLGRLARGVDG